MKKIVELTLPEWAWVDGGDHEQGGNPTQGRNIMMHIRSASVMEVLDADCTELHSDTIKYGFNYINSFGVVEPKIIALHFSPLLDPEDNYDTIIDILKKGMQWYIDWCDWEDNNIAEENLSVLN